MNKPELLRLAREARERAYCPYSGVSVGAALLGASGKIYLGANIENAAHSPGLCAERVAFAKAVSEGEREFSAIAVSGGRRGDASRDVFPPCGVCRQVMAEFCKEDFDIILGDEENPTVKTLGELLPLAFTL